jgi:hypothetical protein
MSGCDSSAWSSWVVGVDEAGRDDAAGCIEGVLRRMVGERADRSDAAVDDADVGVEARRPRAVDDGAAADQQVE